MTNKILSFLFIVTILSSCNYRSSIMLRMKDFEYTTKKDTAVDYQYKIKPNDYLDFRLYTNDGFKLVDMTTLNSNVNLGNNRLIQDYLVEYDGFVKLPLIDRVNLSGMTIKEAQKFLEEEYSKYYIDPFVLARIVNRRVIVFAGDGSAGQVVTLANNNVTLIEGLALAGGIGSSGKARKIRLIRGNPENPEVYHIDLSTIEGMKQANFILQANDIIYVEPRISLTRAFTTEVAPIIGLISSMITMFVVLDRL